jgi:hypothetical protein
MAMAPESRLPDLRTGLLGGAAFLALGLLAGPASADEADAKALLKAMSDYMGSQQQFSASYDTSFEVVTAEHQKLQVGASGDFVLQRPDKLRATRHGGFANVEMVFDGKTFTILGKEANIYVQDDVPGTVEHLIDEVRDRLQKSIPGADFLVPNIYDELMEAVTDVKDLGSGVVGGQECDHLAFRTPDFDWQIWIAQGPEPYPCRYVITSTQVDMAPQYTLELTDWKAGSAVAETDFGFKAPQGAQEIDPKDVKAMSGLGDMPSNFTLGAAQ